MDRRLDGDHKGNMGKFALATIVLVVLAACSADSGYRGTYPSDDVSSPLDTTPSCPVSQVLCGAMCVSTATDSANCGTCGNACTAGQTCTGGACMCSAGLSGCGGRCVDTQSDNANCAACGRGCQPGQSCVAGACVSGCPAPNRMCGDVCTSVATDAANCGGCGRVCPTSQACVSGACVCPGGRAACGDSCVDTQTNAMNCGGCGNRCSSGACVGGTCVTAMMCPSSCRANGDCAPCLSSGDPGAFCCVSGLCAYTSGVCGGADAGIPDVPTDSVVPPTGSLTATWTLPALVQDRTSSTLYLPSYISHLFGHPVTHPAVNSLSCATIRNTTSITQIVSLTVSLAVYAPTPATLADISVAPGATVQRCLTPTFDTSALRRITSAAAARVEARATASSGALIGSVMQPIVVLPLTSLLLSYPGTTFQTMGRLAAVAVTPADPDVQGYLRTAASYSAFGTFGDSPTYRPVYSRTTPSIPVGSYVSDAIFLEAGEAFAASLSSVVGGTDANINVRLFTPAQFSTWRMATPTTATREWLSQRTGATISYASATAGWYVLVFDNDRSNFVSRTVTWSRSNTREDIVEDALRSIYNALRARGVVYTDITAGFDVSLSGQNYRLPSQTLATRSANCIDGSLLFASLIELLRLQPQLVLVQRRTGGHAYVGARMPGSSFVWPIETTMLGTDDFDAAFNAALAEYADDLSSSTTSGVIVDVTAERTAGILPIP